MDLLVHLVALCFAFMLCWYMVTLIPLPPPVAGAPAPPFRNVLLILLCLVALGVLAGEFGLWGTWGIYRHR